MKSSTCFLFAVSVLGFAFAPQLVALFQDDPQVVAHGAAALRFQCVTFCFHGLDHCSNHDAPNHRPHGARHLPGHGAAGHIFIPLVFLLTAAVRFLGVQMTQAVSDLLTLLCAIPIQLAVMRGLSDEVARPLAKEGLFTQINANVCVFTCESAQLFEVFIVIAELVLDLLTFCRNDFIIILSPGKRSWGFSFTILRKRLRKGKGGCSSARARLSGFWLFWFLYLPM